MYHVDKNHTIDEIGAKLFNISEECIKERGKILVETASKIDDEGTAKFLEQMGFYYFTTNAWGIRSWRKKI